MALQRFAAVPKPKVETSSSWRFTLRFNSRYLFILGNFSPLRTGTDWHAGPALHVRQGRVAVTGGSVVDDPKSQRSRRDLPLPA
jgi:hypothetical protein